MPITTPTCYFSIPVINTSVTHFSQETPTTSPLSAYTPDTPSDPRNPLLALRDTSPEYSYASMSSPGVDPSRLLQLQTSAAHPSRPAARPLQQSSPTSSTASDSSSSSTSSRIPTMLCCSRCRRESGSGMIQFGTNIYYCNHCARMTGYCAG